MQVLVQLVVVHGVGVHTAHAVVGGVEASLSGLGGRQGAHGEGHAAAVIGEHGERDLNHVALDEVWGSNPVVAFVFKVAEGGAICMGRQHSGLCGWILPG